MEININNYEVFVIDFIDGKLNEVDTESLFAFLGQNPALKDEFDLLTNTSNSIPIETVSFDSSSLLKPINIDVNNYSEKLIGLIENDLSPLDKVVLLSELNLYPELKKEHDLFLKTKVVADTNIVFKNKEILTQKPFRIIPLFTKISAIAALFIAVIIVFYFVNNNNSNYQVAINEAIVKAKQDSISNIIKSRNNVPKQLQLENEKQMLAFGGINAALVKRNGKKPMVSPAIPFNKNNKNSIKENPLNNNNNQSGSPTPLPKKILSENGLLNNNIAQIDVPKSDVKPIITENITTPILPKNAAIAMQNKENNDGENNDKSLTTYVKQQLQITAQSEVIAVNKPTNSTENITLAESIGLNVLSIYNMVSNHDVKVKKTYNNDGEIEKVRLVATGW
ncbi:MAG: hypothetical protein ACOYMA_14785 [Bacteroidia bacterium]